MMIIALVLIQMWAQPIKIIGDTAAYIDFKYPFAVSDRQGKIWFSWNEEHWPYHDYVLARYYEAGMLSDVDTVVPLDVVDEVRGLTYCNDSTLWVVGENDDAWASHYVGGEWSDVIQVPGYPSTDYRYHATSDSNGNYWVAWTTDWFAPYPLQSSYHDGTQWSSIITVSGFRPGDAEADGMTTDGNGRPWVIWRLLVGAMSDSCFVNQFNGISWTPCALIEKDMDGFSWLRITASLTDSSVFVSYRRLGGTIYVLRYVSISQPPETVWVTTEFEQLMAMTCDDLGYLWMFPIDSLGLDDRKLYSAVWDGDSVTIPVPVDTGDGYFPCACFDPVERRVWVVYQNHHAAPKVIYATYSNVEGVAENPRSYAVRTGLHIFPNPFTKSTKISLNHVQNTECIGLKIYNISGRLVKSFLLSATYSLLPSIIWDGTDNTGQPLSSGVYFIHYETHNRRIVEKIVLLR